MGCATVHNDFVFAAPSPEVVWVPIDLSELELRKGHDSAEKKLVRGVTALVPACSNVNRHCGHARVVECKVLIRQQVHIMKDEGVIALLLGDLKSNVQELATIELNAVLILRALLLDHEDVEFLNLAISLELAEHIAHMWHELLKLSLAPLTLLNPKANHNRNARYLAICLLAVCGKECFRTGFGAFHFCGCRVWVYVCGAHRRGPIVPVWCWHRLWQGLRCARWSVFGF